jgi:PAS domain S-box-containing protein
LRTPIELQAEVDARTADLQATNQRLRQEIAAREENEMRMRLALEASGAATWTIDYTKAAIERFDARSCQLAGLDGARADWPAGTFCKLLHPEDREQMQLASRQTHAVAGPGPLVEYRIVTSGQEVHWMQGAGIVQRNTQGEPERFIGVSIDITDRKRLESQLLHTIERLAVADRRKNEFLATLAHELRNPLAPISNGLQTPNPVAPRTRPAYD